MTHSRIGHRIMATLALSCLVNITMADCLEGGYVIDTDTLGSVYAHPTEAHTVFVTQNPPGPDGLALMKSCDGGQTWSATALTTEFYAVTSLAIDPTDPETVYVIANRGGLVSRDGGITFEETDIPFGTLVFAGDGTLYSHDSNQVSRRAAGQDTWQALTPTPTPFDVLRLHPGDPARMHVGQYYSVDAGASWQRVLPNRPRDVRYSVSNPMNMIVTAEPALISNDGGVNWMELPFEEFEPLRLGDFEGTIVEIDRNDPDVLWLATRRCGLWRSDNGGGRWRLPMNGLTGGGDFCSLGESRNVVIEQLEISDADPSRIYTITPDGLFATTSAGNEWLQIHGATGSPAPPPPNPFSGNADLSIRLSGLPGSFTPPVTFRFTGSVRNDGPDTAREATISIQADIVSSTHGICGTHTCDFGDVPPGTVIQLTFEREVLGGGSGTRCNGDVFELRGSVSATTRDPVAGNNVATLRSTRQNGTSIISGCPGEGILQPEDKSGGGAASPLFLFMLLLTFAGLSAYRNGDVRRAPRR